jgi:hypothetical protein
MCELREASERLLKCFRSYSSVFCSSCCRDEASHNRGVTSDIDLSIRRMKYIVGKGNQVEEE